MHRLRQLSRRRRSCILSAISRSLARKPAELCHYGVSGEPILTHGWFHIVGQLESGRDAWEQTGENNFHLESEPYPGIKSIGVTARVSQVAEPFVGQQLVQLEFESTVPWVTEIPPE
jgi:hypothetical protein